MWVGGVTPGGEFWNWPTNSSDRLLICRTAGRSRLLSLGTAVAPVEANSANVDAPSSASAFVMFSSSLAAARIQLRCARDRTDRGACAVQEILTGRSERAMASPG